MSVVNNKVAWVSGTNGTVGLTKNGGKTWKWMKIEGYETIDFRDIEAFSKRKAVVMGVGSPAYILRTTNGGKSWDKVYENSDSAMFLDAMTFWNDDSGIAIGDPIDGHFFVLRTFNGGKTWKKLPPEKSPQATPGEVCFAASGSNIAPLSLDEAVFVSGGSVSNLFYRDEKIKLPLAQGAATIGANAIAIKHDRIMIAVGGNFANAGNREGNCAISLDRGSTWDIPSVSPNGYRSGVAYIQGDDWITCGINGVDFSSNDGDTWSRISTSSFHVVKRAKKGNAVYLAGPKGKIAKLQY